MSIDRQVRTPQFVLCNATRHSRLSFSHSVLISGSAWRDHCLVSFQPLRTIGKHIHISRGCPRCRMHVPRGSSWGSGCLGTLTSRREHLDRYHCLAYSYARMWHASTTHSSVCIRAWLLHDLCLIPDAHVAIRAQGSVLQQNKAKHTSFEYHTCMVAERSV